jgi:hypothetical protein
MVQNRPNMKELMDATDEADPLFFKYQRGEGSEQEWLDKIEEIRERFPYPTEE